MSIEKWAATSREDRGRFFAWVESEIERLRAGGQVPDCFEGTPEEMIASLQAERDRYLEWEKGTSN